VTEDRFPESIDFHLDILCPFAFQTSRWMREVRRQTGLVINWRFFSLEEVNRVEGKKHPWERTWSYGWSMMRIAAYLRRTDPELLDKWLLAAGRALHVQGRRPHDPDVARLLLESIGADPAVVDLAIADETTNDEIKADHQRVLDASGYGVPTLFFPSGHCVFGPVLMDPPMDDAAIRLWRAVTAWDEFPHLFELQHPKTPADQDYITTTIRPYLEARDWVSFDRGEVIDFGDKDPQRERTEAFK
jgi:2-hydroxychromene-2-carboxylate isomerase